jgi:hypothetical protein
MDFAVCARIRVVVGFGFFGFVAAVCCVDLGSDFFKGCGCYLVWEEFSCYGVVVCFFGAYGFIQGELRDLGHLPK